MYRKFMTLLKLIANEIVLNDLNFEESNVNMMVKDYNVADLYEDLMELESLGIMTDEDIDTLKSFLTYVIAKDTHIDRDEIYSMVFGRGKRIVWH
ncbi:hypothetical protein [Candidatus Magnetomonas plexicatena]|uniref:hypothetical protein n=1 Tax=Candidatus Magnetomonas plexicatena TaxID=2552947 RepID=UPI001C76F829|nr:hypothetical protein E2O03_000455 [Nitrospirales bacterium LBB_01]